MIARLGGGGGGGVGWEGAGRLGFTLGSSGLRGDDWMSGEAERVFAMRAWDSSWTDPWIHVCEHQSMPGRRGRALARCVLAAVDRSPGTTCVGLASELPR